MYFRLMKKILLGVLLLTLGHIPVQLNACGKKKVHRIKMERTPCMGTCPWYIVEIQENGLVKYWGKKDVARIGYYEGKIDKRVAKSLLRKFSRKDVLKAQKEYQATISDIAMIHYTFSIGDDRNIKKVRQANFGPAYFIRYAQEIDLILKGVRWKRAIDNDNQ